MSSAQMGISQSNSYIMLIKFRARYLILNDCNALAMLFCEDLVQSSRLARAQESCKNRDGDTPLLSDLDSLFGT